MKTLIPEMERGEHFSLEKVMTTSFVFPRTLFPFVLDDISHTRPNCEFPS